ncbi:unnamed protein product [Parajaminaea phylloscopi]
MTSYSVPKPVITYRHLVSAGTLNAANPLRVVSLCDIDAAYAAFEAKRLNIDPFATPLAVQQWQGLIAISYAARAHGISRHETVEEAKKKCPDIVLVHVATYAEGSETAQYNENPRSETHKVSLDPYRRESRKVVAIFNEMCPLGAIEKASIDEMYCDLTLAVRQLILQRFPHLARPPPDSPHGLDTALPPPPTIDWTDLGHRLPTKPSDPVDAPCPAEDPEGHAPETDGKGSERIIEQAESWSDYALACGAELILKVRSEIQSRLGYTMSAGVAPNKTLAKLSASERKPNGQTTMLPAAIPLYLKDLPVSKIRFLGGKLGRAIEAEWQSSTAGDLWSVPLAEMQQKFGEESRWVYDVLRGIDHSAVIERTKNKTMLASKNVTPPIRTTKEAHRWLSILSNELCVRLKEAREEAPSLWPSTLTLRYLRKPDAGGSAEARSRQAAFPFVKDLKPQIIFAAAEKLCTEVFGSSDRLDAEIITIALGFSGLEAGEQGQRSLHGFFAQGQSTTSASNAKPQGAGDDAENANEATAGAASVAPPISSPAVTSLTRPPGPADESLVRKKKKVKVGGLDSLFAKAAATAPIAGPSKLSPIEGEEMAVDAKDAGAEAIEEDTTTADGDAGPSWLCPACSHRILPRPPVAAAEASSTEAGQARPDGVQEGRGEDTDAKSDVERRLRLARQDHEDYHFALDLETQERGLRAQALMPRGSLPSQGLGQTQSQSQSHASPSQSGLKRSAKASGSPSTPASSSQKRPRGLQNFFAKRTGD